MAEQKAIPLKTERIAANCVLRYFNEPPSFPACVVPNIFDYVGPATLWTLQVLSADLPDRLRNERKYQKAIAYEEFEFITAQDNINKVVWYLSSLGMRSALAFVKKQWPNRVHDIMVACGGVRYPDIVRNHLNFKAEWTCYLIDTAAKNSVLDTVYGLLTDDHFNGETITAPTLANTFNNNNTLNSRIWLLRKSTTEMGDIETCLCHYRISQIAIEHPDDILPTNDDEALFKILYYLAIASNNRELAIYARLRVSQLQIDCTPAPPGCSLTLWEEMRKIDKIHNAEERTSEEHTSLDKTQLFHRKCMEGSVQLSDIPANCNADDISKGIRCGIRYGGPKAIAELSTYAWDTTYELLATHGATEIIRTMIQRESVDSKPVANCLQQAASAGFVDIVNVIFGKFPNISSHGYISIPGDSSYDDIIQNASSDSRDRFKARKTMLERSPPYTCVVAAAMKCKKVAMRDSPNPVPFPADILPELKMIEEYIGIDDLTNAVIAAIDHLILLCGKLRTTTYENIQDQIVDIAHTEQACDNISYAATRIGITMTHIQEKIQNPEKLKHILEKVGARLP